MITAADRTARMARQLAIAFVSHHLGVNFQTAMNNYGDEAPGPYWIALAEQVLADYRAGRIGGGL